MKTVIAVGFYDDFARFYLELKKELVKLNYKFIYFSIYPSGFIYFLTRFNKCSLISLKARTRSLIYHFKYRNQLKIDSDYYLGVNLNEVIHYHLNLKIGTESSLKILAMSYVDLIGSIFLKTQPDILYLSGDTRLSIEVFSRIARRYKTRVYYFEQGPFGTTIIDERGVNANASIRNYEFPTTNIDNVKQSVFVKQFLNRSRSKKYNRSPIYRSSDYIFQYLLDKFLFLPMDIKMTKEVRVSKTLYDSVEKKFYHNCFLLILQVPYDANMLHHSPLYKNHFSIVKDLFKNLPSDYKLVVREHPLFKGKYEKELYQFLVENKISLDQNDLQFSINHARAIVVNNSTVGIEAIAQLKTVVVLGNAYYDREDICLKLKKSSDLKNLLLSAVKYKVPEDNIYRFLYYLFKNYLYVGHFRDKELVAPKEIVTKQFNEYEKQNT